MKLYDDVQNQSYTRELITEIENKDKDFSETLGYSAGSKAILIDKTGKAFYRKTVKQYRDLETYDTYRTYKKKNIKRIGDLFIR